MGRHRIRRIVNLDPIISPGMQLVRLETDLLEGGPKFGSFVGLEHRKVDVIIPRQDAALPDVSKQASPVQIERDAMLVGDLGNALEDASLQGKRGLIPHEFKRVHRRRWRWLRYERRARAA